MWEVYERREVTKRLPKLPTEILKRWCSRLRP